MDFVGRWSQKTEIAICVLVLWLGIRLSKYYDWRKRYGKVNEHNAKIPRDHWLTEAEKRAILDYEREYPLEGYRRLTFMMLDDDVAAASPATVYRVLKSADRLRRPSPANERKGKGFHQPSRPHRHWHIDFSHLNVCGTFYHLCSILDAEKFDVSPGVVYYWIERGMLSARRRNRGSALWITLDLETERRLRQWAETSTRIEKSRSQQSQRSL